MKNIQKSKKAREYRKQAIFAQLPKNTAHPSHLKARDHRAVREYYEKINKERSFS